MRSFNLEIVLFFSAFDCFLTAFRVEILSSGDMLLINTRFIGSSAAGDLREFFICELRELLVQGFHLFLEGIEFFSSFHE